MKKFQKISNILLTTSMTVALASSVTSSVWARASAAEASTNSYLDLEEDDTYGEQQSSIQQTYTHTIKDKVYTDVTKVKLDWEIKDIAITKKQNKIWNPDDLSWEDTSAVAVSIAEREKDARFTLTNLSSVKVKATASFKADDIFTSAYNNQTTVFTNNECIIGTVVKSDREVDTSLDHDEIIDAKLGLNNSAFEELTSSSNVKLGTYTVTLSANEFYTITFPYGLYETNGQQITELSVPAGTVIGVSGNTLTINGTTITYILEAGEEFYEFEEITDGTVVTSDIEIIASSAM